MVEAERWVAIESLHSPAVADHREQLGLMNGSARRLGGRALAVKGASEG